MNIKIPDGLVVIIVVVFLATAVGLAYWLATPGQLSQSDVNQLAAETRSTAMREAGREFEPATEEEASGDMMAMGGGNTRAPEPQPGDDTRKKFRKKS